MADYRKVVEQDSVFGEYNTAHYALLALGEKDKAIAFLEKALDKGFRRFVHIANDDDMDSLRDMPEFEALIEKYRKKAEAEERKQKEELGIKNNLKEYTCEIPFSKENGACYVKCKK